MVIAAVSGSISPAISSLLVESSVLEMQDFSEVMNQADVLAVRSPSFLAQTSTRPFISMRVAAVKYVQTTKQVFFCKIIAATTYTTKVQSFKNELAFLKVLFPTCIHTARL